MTVCAEAVGWGQEQGAAVDALHVEYAETHDPATRERLVLAHMPLALHLAKRFGPRSNQTQEDVNQVAFLALVKAVEGFDPHRGIRFSTYAARTIVGELKRNLRDHGWAVRPSRGAHDLYLATESALEDLTHELRRSPTVSELAERVGVEVEDILCAREVATGRVATSLDQPVREPQQRLSDLIGDVDRNLRRVEQRATVRSLLTVLDEQERVVVRLRFGLAMTQAEIAREIGSSQMHVSRVLRRAIQKLRGALDDPAPAGPQDVSFRGAGSGRRRRHGRPERLRQGDPSPPNGPSEAAG